MTADGTDLPRVVIIVLNWNGGDDTLACLESLAGISYPNHAVLLADNGSHDDSVARVQAHYPQVEILLNGANLGYAGGNNRAIAHVLPQRPDFVLLLNNDVVVATDFLEHLVEAARTNPTGGFFGAMTLAHGEYSAYIEALGGCYWDPVRLDFRSLARHEPAAQHADPTPVALDYATGSCLLVRTSVIETIGLMDEKFFLTFEESDWCYRGRDAGFQSYGVPAARAWHKVSVSFGGAHSPLVDYFMTRNRLYFARRHLPFGVRVRLFLRAVGLVLAAVWPRFRLGARPEKVSRLRFAYWGVRRFLCELWSAPRSPRLQARLLGLIDFLHDRGGDCPAPLRQRLTVSRPGG